MSGFHGIITGGAFWGFIWYYFARSCGKSMYEISILLLHVYFMGRQLGLGLGLEKMLGLAWWGFT